MPASVCTNANEKPLLTQFSNMAFDSSGRFANRSNQIIRWQWRNAWKQGRRCQV